MRVRRLTAADGAAECATRCRFTKRAAWTEPPRNTCRFTTKERARQSFTPDWSRRFAPCHGTLRRHTSCAKGWGWDISRVPARQNFPTLPTSAPTPAKYPRRSATTPWTSTPRASCTCSLSANCPTIKRLLRICGWAARTPQTPRCFTASRAWSRPTV